MVCVRMYMSACVVYVCVRGVRMYIYMSACVARAMQHPKPVATTLPSPLPFSGGGGGG